MMVLEAVLVHSGGNALLERKTLQKMKVTATHNGSHRITSEESASSNSLMEPPIVIEQEMIDAGIKVHTKVEQGLYFQKGTVLIDLSPNLQKGNVHAAGPTNVARLLGG